MTERAYLRDTDRRTFDAVVDRVVDDRVVLDRTLFYPTGGGQPHDTGTLRPVTARDDGDGDAGDGDGGGDADASATVDGDAPGWRVVDVRARDDVYHRVEPVDGGDSPARPTPAEGTRVRGDLDWARRRAHTRYHTAQHLLSAFLLAEFDAATTGNALYDDHAHLDCAYDRFTDADLATIEAGLNGLVDAALPVWWYELDRADAETRLDGERTRFDLLPESITEVRIVEVGGDGPAGPATPADAAADPYDRTACAGTHVADTASIGPVTVTGRQTRGADEERVGFELGTGPGADAGPESESA